MSLAAPAAATAADARATLVGVLADLTGMTPVPTAPDTATAGAVWPSWIQTTYTGPLCRPSRHTWDVIAILPADETGHTIDVGDQVRDLVAERLATVANLSYSEPIQWTFRDQQTMPAVRFRLTTRHIAEGDLSNGR